MAKIITDQELGEMVGAIVHSRGGLVLPDADYQRFLLAVAEAVTDACGGTVGTVSSDDDSLGHTVAFRLDERVPADGGVYRGYDTDVTWLGNKENQ